MNVQQKTKNGETYWIVSLRPTLNPDDNEVNTKVMGVTFNGRQDVVAKLKVGEIIELEREPDNRYDRNAIRVQRIDGSQIGYLNRFLAEDLAPTFDASQAPVQARVTKLKGNRAAGHNIGVQINFTIPKL